MKITELSLRQRKILYLLNGRDDYVPSAELAKVLKVSSRTVRNDIHQMNQALSEHHAAILSSNSKGFLFQAAEPEKIMELTHVSHAFMDGQERLRYLTFLLCRSDRPRNLYDLEEEIFVSRSALISDIHALRRRFTYDPPNIRLILKGDTVCFEQDENKIRDVLLRLTHEDWDYAANRNAFYDHSFLDRDLLELLMDETPRILYRFSLFVDSSTMTALELVMAIMYYRCLHGHMLHDGQTVPQEDSPFREALDALFVLIEGHTGITFPDAERFRIYRFLSNTHLDRRLLDVSHPACGLFPARVQEEARKYLSEIRNVFGIDFSADTEFLHALHLFLQQLSSGSFLFYQHADFISISRLLSAEYELAWLYQQFAPDFVGRFLEENELCILVTCLSGAIRYYLAAHPEKKLNAVLLSHRNVAAAWGLKRKILESFQFYLNITDMLPLSYLDHYDLSDADLVFTTLRIDPARIPGKQVMYVNDHPAADPVEDAMQVKILTFKNIWPMPPLSVEALFASAYWHENEEFTDRYQVIDRMTQDYIADGIAGKEHAMDIVQREARISFSVRPDIVFLHTVLPVPKTQLSVMTLKHRIRWNDFRTAVIVMAMFREEDRNLLFHLNLRFNQADFDAGSLRFLKTKEELLPVLWP